MKQITSDIYQHTLKTNQSSAAAAPELFIQLKPDQKLITLKYLFDYGSADESWEKNGITNLLVRLSGKKTSRYPSQFKLMRELEKNGVVFSSSVGKESHQFQIQTTDWKLLKHSLPLFHQIIFAPVFTNKLLRQEKKLILHDLRELQAQPRDWAAQITTRALWPRDPYGTATLGRPNTLDKITVSDLEQHLKTLRENSKLLIGISGNLDSEEVIQLFTESVPGKLKGGFRNRQAPKNPQQTEVATDNREIEQINLQIGFPSPGYRAADYWTQLLFNSVVGQGLMSRFYRVRTQHSLAYYYSSSYQAYQREGGFFVYGGVPKQNLSQVFAETARQINDIQQGNLGGPERERGLNYLLGNMERQLEESPKMLSFILGGYRMWHQLLNFKEWKTRLREVKLQDLTNFARQVLVPQKMVVGVVGPAGKDNVKSQIQENFAT